MPSASELDPHLGEGEGHGFDALLVLSFGGPEGPQDVIPFLENVTRGRGIPRERLEEVGEHYFHFGGRSPLNEHNRSLVAALRDHLAAGGRPLPVYFGNRNWHPFLEDELRRMAADGVRRALVLATSAWGGYSGCRQYHEDLARGRAAVPECPELVKLRGFHDHPLFIEAQAVALRAALAKVPSGASPRVVFTAHSVPTAADVASGLPEDGGRLYSRQVAEAARLTAQAAGVDEYDIAWQSRSGPPSVPWLEPDVNGVVPGLVAAGYDALVVSPIGFLSDHIEVVWDLDTELARTAADAGMTLYRADTIDTDEAFVRMVEELVLEQTDDVPGRRLGVEEQYGHGCDGRPCAPTCCAPTRRPVAVE